MNNAVAWRAPSNIALIKYWGKRGKQIPANPSLSFTLQNAYTQTEIRYAPKKNNTKAIDLKFFFEGKDKPEFAEKIKDYFKTLVKKELPFLSKFSFEIYSGNSFPHSAGIASSASSMAALALCLCSIEEQIKGKPASPDKFFRRASHIARLGSGSAARSVYGGIVTWGKIKGIPAASNQYATPLSGRIHHNFLHFQDTILVVSRKSKAVSSRAGHALMQGHPFATARIRQAADNLQDLIKVLRNGNLQAFCDIVENEALTLHALMLASRPPVLLWEPATVDIIRSIQAFRQQTGIPACFTIDAGPNVHLLYPESASVDIRQYIEQQLMVNCTLETVIYDHTGTGPVKLK
ncbi:MAG: diphosphomevalonate decarboxylase [Chitinophagales bacterium]|nr:MAG: diphosphomevalonate decarboxylase [Chitinophagales bacterium]